MKKKEICKGITAWKTKNCDCVTWMSMLRQMLSNKACWACFAGNAVIVFASFSVMLTFRFSTDTYSNYFSAYDPSGNLALGRFACAGTQLLLGVLGVNTVTNQVLLNALLCFLIAFIATSFWSQIINGVETADCNKKLAVDALIMLAFINIPFVEFFYFSNCSIQWGGMLLFTWIALMIFLKTNGAPGKILAVLALVISINYYQAGIGFFIIWGITLVLAQNKVTTGRKTTESVFSLLIIGAVSCVISVFAQMLVETWGFTYGTNRSPTISLQIISRNARILATSGQKNIFVEGLGFLGGSIGIVISLYLVCMIYVVISNKTNLKTILLILLTTFINYGIVFAPHLISQEIWLAPRTVFSLFSFISYCGIVALLISKKQKICPALCGMIACLFILINVKEAHSIGINQIVNNRIDAMSAEVILEKVNEYEAKNDTSVTKIALCNDTYRTYSNSQVDGTYMDMNLRVGAIGWAIPSWLSYYSEKIFLPVDMPEEIYSEYFEGKEWDSFEPEEQIMIVDDTLYMALY